MYFFFAKKYFLNYRTNTNIPIIGQIQIYQIPNGNRDEKKFLYPSKVRMDTEMILRKHPYVGSHCHV